MLDPFCHQNCLNSRGRWFNKKKGVGCTCGSSNDDLLLPQFSIFSWQEWHLLLQDLTGCWFGSDTLHIFIVMSCHSSYWDPLENEYCISRGCPKQDQIQITVAFILSQTTSGISKVTEGCCWLDLFSFPDHFLSVLEIVLHDSSSRSTASEKLRPDCLSPMTVCLAVFINIHLHTKRNDVFVFYDFHHWTHTWGKCNIQVTTPNILINWDWFALLFYKCSRINATASITKAVCPAFCHLTRWHFALWVQFAGYTGLMNNAVFH